MSEFKENYRVLETNILEDDDVKVPPHGIIPVIKFGDEFMLRETIGGAIRIAKGEELSKRY